MHVHRAAVDLHPINTYSAANDRAAAAAQRAAEVRKRLLKKAQTIATDATGDQSNFLGYLIESRNHQLIPDDQYHPSSQSNDPDFR